MHLKMGLRCSPGAYGSPSCLVQIMSCLPVLGFFCQKLRPCCLVGVGRGRRTSEFLPESKSALETYPMAVIVCNFPDWPGVQPRRSSYLMPLALIMSPVTWYSRPLRSFGSCSTNTPSWYRFTGSSGSGAAESISVLKTRYQTSRFAVAFAVPIAARRPASAQEGVDDRSAAVLV